MMWIQICARSPWPGACSPELILLKKCNLARSECSKICYYQPKNEQVLGLLIHNSKTLSPYISPIPIQISMLARK